MKEKIFSIMIITGMIVFLVNCASVPKSQKPARYQLSGLYVTRDAKQMTGTPKDTARMEVGDTIIIYARGMSSSVSGRKWFMLPAKVKVTWSADKQLKIIREEAHSVTVQVVVPISGEAHVKASTVITRLTKYNRATDKVTLEFSSISKKFKIMGK